MGFLSKVESRMIQKYLIEQMKGEGCHLLKWRNYKKKNKKQKTGLA